MNIKETVMHRMKNNPIITPSDVEKGYAMLDCGQTMYDGKYMLLIPVQRKDKNSPAIYTATSSDGINFEISEKPLIIPSQRYAELDKYVTRPSVSYILEDDM